MIAASLPSCSAAIVVTGPNPPSDEKVLQPASESVATTAREMFVSRIVASLFRTWSDAFILLPPRQGIDGPQGSISLKRTCVLDRSHPCVWISRVFQDERDRRADAAGNQQRKKNDKRDVHGPPDLWTGKGRAFSERLAKRPEFRMGCGRDLRTRYDPDIAHGLDRQSGSRVQLARGGGSSADGTKDRHCSARSVAWRCPCATSGNCCEERMNTVEAHAAAQQEFCDPACPPWSLAAPFSGQ